MIARRKRPLPQTCSTHPTNRSYSSGVTPASESSDRATAANELSRISARVRSGRVAAYSAATGPATASAQQDDIVRVPRPSPPRANRRPNPPTSADQPTTPDPKAPCPAGRTTRPSRTTTSRSSNRPCTRFEIRRDPGSISTPGPARSRAARPRELERQPGVPTHRVPDIDLGVHGHIVAPCRRASHADATQVALPRQICRSRAPSFCADVLRGGACAGSGNR